MRVKYLNWREMNLLKLNSFTKILENDSEQQEIVYKALKEILENVLNNPTKFQFRKIHLLSENLVTNLMPFSGGLEFLFEIGFVENEDNLMLPETVNLNNLKEVLDQLNRFFIKKPKVAEERKVPIAPPKIINKNAKNSNYLEIAAQVNYYFFFKLIFQVFSFYF